MGKPTESPKDDPVLRMINAAVHHPPMSKGEGITLLLAEQDDDDDECECGLRRADHAALHKAGAGGHKYVLRVPSGKPSPKWRYYYNVPGKGLVSSEHVVRGARFAGEDQGQAGHWHVTDATGWQHGPEDYSPIVLRHTATGRTKTVNRGEFRSLVNNMPAAREAAQKRHADIREAMGVLSEGTGGGKQADRVHKLIDHAHRSGAISDQERETYRGQVAKRQKLQDEERARVSADPVASALAALPPEHREALRKYIEGEKAKATPPSPPSEMTGGVRDGGLGLRGKEDTLLIADESGTPQRTPIRYRLVEAADLTPSHDPETWQPHKAYPPGVQERRYHDDRFAQAEVVKHARALVAELLVNDNPDAVNGPSVIQPDGVVLGGNSRVMTLARAYKDFPGKADEYRKLLADRAGRFGFSASDVHGMKAPMLVREVAEQSPKAQADLVRRFNESYTREMDPRSEQVARARRIGDKTIGALRETLGTSASGEGTDETFDAYLASPRSKALIRAMLDEGVLDMRNVSKYVNQKGAKKDLFNEEGRALASKLLLGKVVDDADTLEGMGHEYRQKLAPHLPHILRAAAANPAYDLTGAVKTAAETIAEMRARGHATPLDTIGNRELSTEDARGKDHPVMRDPLTQHVIAALWGKGSREIGPGFRKFAEAAEKDVPSQGGMFADAPSSDETARAAIGRAFGFETSNPLKEVSDEKDEDRKAAAEVKKQRAAKKLAAKLKTREPEQQEAAA